MPPANARRRPRPRSRPIVVRTPTALPRPATGPTFVPTSSTAPGTFTPPTATGSGAVVIPSGGLSGTATVDTHTSGPLGGISDFITTKLPAYFKVGAGGLVVMISGLALVYVAGRNTAPVAAAKTAAKVVNPVAGAAAGAAAKTEGGQARSIARKTRATEKTERAKSRVVTDAGSGKVSVSSKRSAADARAAGDQHRADAPKRSKESLAKLSGKSKAKTSGSLNSKARGSVIAASHTRQSPEKTAQLARNPEHTARMRAGGIGKEHGAGYIPRGSK